jgi:hypothetical protein
VGFECKTSDKLSRRAFPRGYTESLEERVRILEAEVRDLKELLDEKDEKIDMLARIRSHGSPQIQTSWLTPPRTSSLASAAESPEAPQQLHLKDDAFKPLHSSGLVDDENNSHYDSSYFTGSSSGRALIGKCTLSFGSCSIAPWTDLPPRASRWAHPSSHKPVVLTILPSCLHYSFVQAEGTRKRPR